MNPTYEKQIGDIGEGIAEKYLKRHKYQVFDKNFRTRSGELDLIAFDPLDRNLIVFIEVKTKISSKYGGPIQNLTRDKVYKMWKTAWFYIKSKKLNKDIFRLDLITVKIDKLNKTAKIKHLKAIGLES